MRPYILAISLIVFPAFAGTAMVAKQGDDSVRIFDEPCKAASVLRHIPPANRKKFRKAESHFGGQRWFACWVLQGANVYLVYEDDDRGLVPVGAFKEDVGV